VSTTVLLNPRAIEAETTAIRQVVADEQMSYPCVLDARARWAVASGLNNVPAFLLVGRDGRRAHILYGTLRENTSEFTALTAAIDAALAAPRPPSP
jgi:hypothetical protein